MADRCNARVTLLRVYPASEPRLVELALGLPKAADRFARVQSSKMKHIHGSTVFRRERFVVALLLVLAFLSGQTSGFVASVSALSLYRPEKIDSTPTRLFDSNSDDDDKQQEEGETQRRKDDDEEEGEIQMSTVRIDDGGSDLTDRFKYKVNALMGAFVSAC